MACFKLSTLEYLFSVIIEEKSELLDLAVLHTLLSCASPLTPTLLLHPTNREVIKTDRVAKSFISQTYKHRKKDQTYYLLTCIVL